MNRALLTRRRLIIGGASVIGAGLVANQWGRISDASSYEPMLRMGESLNMRLQRVGLWNRPLAPEYRRDQISRHHPSNGGIGAPWADRDPVYDRLAATDFDGWQLRIDGLVNKPISLSLDQLRAMPTRSQITLHCCDEGWSAIAEWTGVPLRFLLELAGLQSTARYVFFTCLDKIEGQPMFGSIDLLDAFHPQTILAHTMNGRPLPVAHGAPLRLRIELQIGYKNTKHIDRITVTDSLLHMGKGRGGMIEDAGYQWYAGM